MEVPVWHQFPLYEISAPVFPEKSSFNWTSSILSLSAGYWCYWTRIWIQFSSSKSLHLFCQMFALNKYVSFIVTVHELQPEVVLKPLAATLRFFLQGIIAWMAPPYVTFKIMWPDPGSGPRLVCLFLATSAPVVVGNLSRRRDCFKLIYLFICLHKGVVTKKKTKPKCLRIDLLINSSPPCPVFHRSAPSGPSSPTKATTRSCWCCSTLRTAWTKPFKLSWKVRRLRLSSVFK